MQVENSEIAIRKAALEDGPVIIKLIEGLAHFEKLAPPDEEAGKRLLGDAFGPNPRVEIYMAEVRGEAAGYAFIFETYSTFNARPKLYLEDLFVKPEFRGLKVGLALFRHCVLVAHERGCIKMEWSVLDWNEHALQFYNRLGAEHSREWMPYSLSVEKFKQIIEL